MSLFVIREKNTGAFCYSSKTAYFGKNLQEAAFFRQRKNAQKAISDMTRTTKWLLWADDKSGYTSFLNGGKDAQVQMLKSKYGANNNMTRYTDSLDEVALVCEIVEVKLTLIK